MYLRYISCVVYFGCGTRTGGYDIDINITIDIAISLHHDKHKHIVINIKMAPLFCWWFVSKSSDMYVICSIASQEIFFLD